ncbi:MAG TPA: glycosyltransferase family 4 protein [Thermoleophilaceae bacterium]
MRVLTVGNMYPPHHYGGYELVWHGAVEHLRSQGHDVHVLTTDTDTGAVEPDPPWVRRELRWHLRDGEFARLGPRARAATARHNHSVLERELRDVGPDVVAWWSMGGLSLTMLEAARRRGLPAVAFVHDEWLDYGRWADPWLSVFQGRRRRLLAPLAPLAERAFGVPTRVDFAGAATYVFVSDFTRRHALDLGLGLRRTEVAHSGIDPAFLDPAPEVEWRWRLLYVGRLDARKGVDTAVEALAHLPSGARLEIVGGWDAGEERRLRELAAGLGVEGRAVFAGQRGRDELIAAYGAADAVMFPVRWREPWGLVPLEAMARGRPVVATGRGGSAEYLRDGENCLLFDADDPRGLAAALERLAGDPDLRARLRRGGLETAPRHTRAIFDAAVEDAVTRAAAPAPAPRARARDSRTYA